MFDLFYWKIICLHTVVIGLVVLIVIALLAFSSWRALKPKAPHSIHWRINASLLWLGALCILTAGFVGSTIDDNQVLHEPGFALIPIGYLFFSLGMLSIVVRVVLTAMEHVRRR